MDMDMLARNNFYNVLCFLITENEKLFDRTDSKLYWRTVFHLGVIFHHTNTSLFARNIDLNSHSDVEIEMLKKYRLGYLTGWNFIYLQLMLELEDVKVEDVPDVPVHGSEIGDVLEKAELFQTTFLCLAVSYDTLQWIDKEDTKFGRRLKYYRDVIYNALVVPITLFVTGMFWTVYWIDRELVFPQVYDKIVPWWFNHCVHTVILVVIIVETLLQPRRRPRDEVLETWLHVGATVFYAVVYYSIYFIAHRWLYGVFGIMTWWQVCLFQIFIWSISYFFYRIQFPINRLIHGQTDDEESSNSINVNVIDVKNGIDNSQYQNDSIENQNDISQYQNDNMGNQNDISQYQNDNIEIENDKSHFKNVNLELSDELIVNDNVVRNVENGFDKGCSYVVHDNSKVR